MLHPTPCKEKQYSKFITTYNINNIPQGHLLSWVATSLFCPCLHCLNTEWFALDWNLLDGLAAERQHQKMRGKKPKLQQHSLPWSLVLQKHRETLIPKQHMQKSVLSFLLEFHCHSLPTHTNIQSGCKGAQLLCAHRGHCWAGPGTLSSGNNLLGVNRENSTG